MMDCYQDTALAKPKLFGVCLWIARRKGFDLLTVRIVALILLFAMPVPTLVGYGIGAWLKPTDSPDFD